jgi:hypothetical protein
MSDYKRRLSMLLLSVGLLVGAGCCPRCGSYCAPQGPWQSPTFQATRALLVVNTDELRILRIDGRNVRPSCIGRGGVREYHLPAGTHEITATFRYAAPVSGGLTGEVRGRPLTLQQQFLAGHEYVPVYREHARARRKPKYLLEAIGALARHDRYWSLDIVDLGVPELFPGPEVAEAREYCAIIRRVAGTTNPRQVESLY